MLLNSYARIARNGAILLGKVYTVDAHHDRLMRVVTHAHNDHTKGLRTSVKTTIGVIATPTTHQFLEVLGYSIPPEKRIEVPYRGSIDVMDEKLTLLPARHIAGSAQVLVETRDAVVGYTGDFKLPGTPPMRGLDVLVVDATYGSPRYQRRWSDWDALDALIRLIDESINEGPVWIYGFNGKLQEIMVELRRRGVAYEFMADPVTIRLAMIASRFYGVPIDGIRPYTGGAVDESVVVFTHASKMRYKKRLPGTHIHLTGWEMAGVVRRVSDKVFNVSFSDHATFREVIEYVEEAAPRMVIVDAYRGKDAWFTAKHIEKRLGIPAIAQPEARSLARGGSR